MSVLDYMHDTELFSDYEYAITQMFIEEFCKGDEFSFLREISLSDVKMYWYSDRDMDVLGGFYYPQRNTIYLNREFVKSIIDTTWNGKTNKIAAVFPTIVHELCHYWQSIHYSILYLFLQIPVIREFTIERRAYAVQEKLYDNKEFTLCSVKEYAAMKKKHCFSREFFDDFELKCIDTKTA